MKKENLISENPDTYEPIILSSLLSQQNAKQLFNNKMFQLIEANKNNLITAEIV